MTPVKFVVSEGIFTGSAVRLLGATLKMGGCCGAKPAPSPRKPQSQTAAETEAAAQTTRVLSLQAEKIALLEQEVESLRKVNSAESQGSEFSPPISSTGMPPPEVEPPERRQPAPPIAIRTRQAEPEPEQAQKQEDAPAPALSPHQHRQQPVRKEELASRAEPPAVAAPPSLAAAPSLTEDEEAALATIERMGFQMDNAPESGTVDGLLSTIPSAGSREKESEPLGSSEWRGTYGTIGSSVDERTADGGRPGSAVRVDGVTVELDGPVVDDSSPEGGSAGVRQKLRANANGFQIRVEVPEEDAGAEASGRASVDSNSSAISAPGISPALSDGAMADILAVAEESSQEVLAIAAAQEDEEESLLAELEASVVIEAESDMAVLKHAAEEARQAEEAVVRCFLLTKTWRICTKTHDFILTKRWFNDTQVAARGFHSPISKSTSAKRREIERMLEEAHAEVSAMKAKRLGVADEAAVLSDTPPSGTDREKRPSWYSDSSEEDAVGEPGEGLDPDGGADDGFGEDDDDAAADDDHEARLNRSRNWLNGDSPSPGDGGEVEDGLEAAAFDLKMAAAVVAGGDAERDDLAHTTDDDDEIHTDEEAAPVPLAESPAPEVVDDDEDGLGVVRSSPGHAQRQKEEQDREEALRQARIQALDDRRLAAKRQKAMAELDLQALVVNACEQEEEDPAAAAKRARMLERMAKRSEERADKMRANKEAREAAAAPKRAAAAAATAKKKPAKGKAVGPGGKKTKAAAASGRRDLGPSGDEVNGAMAALQAGNKWAGGAGPRKTGRSARPASDGGVSRPSGGGGSKAGARRPTTAPKAKAAAAGGKTSKAVLAVQEMERKRDARRAVALAQKEKNAAEVAEHGDVKNLHYRQQLDDFREQLAAGNAPIKIPKYRRKADSRVKVCVRKRPLLGAQQEDTAFDVLSCLGGNTLLCHEPRAGVDGRQTFEHTPFLFDAVFGGDDGGAEVYARSVGPEVEELLEPVFSSSGDRGSGSNPRLTVFAYGQTGSGKTYTMGALTEMVLGRLLDAAAGVCATGRRATLGLSYYEIYMAKPYDLLNGRKPCKTQEDAAGQCQVTGLTEVALSIPAGDGEQAEAAVSAAMALLEKGAAARTTAANGVHDASSRSHAIINIKLRTEAAGTGRRRGAEATVSLVDLAGSERASETKQDDAATRLEGAEINKSLLALKECIRALDSAASHTPFRQSVLTQVLREGLEGARSRTVMLATLSPASYHAEHTLNTLRYAARLKELPAGRR